MEKDVEILSWSKHNIILALTHFRQKNILKPS